MPCLSYDTEWFHQSRHRSHTETALKTECDKLARIACKAFALLEQHDPGLKSFKDTEARKWWAAHKKADQARQAQEDKERAKKAEEDKVRKEAIAKLTPEEIEAFGLTKKKK